MVVLPETSAFIAILQTRAAQSERSIYGYTPTRWITYLFLALFTLSTILHVGLAVRYRVWWLFSSFVICSLAESFGWGGRVWSSYDVLAKGGFQMQICCTIFAPTFTLAGVFFVFGQLISRLGQAYSRITSKIYSILFITSDVVALVVQAVGGGIASGTEPVKGGDIMLGGIAFQLFVLTMATVLGIEYFIRYALDKPFHRPPHPDEKQATFRGQADGKTKQMIAAIAAVAFFLFVRAIYRTIELADGWTGTIITTQVYFNVFDGAMIVLVQYILIFFHPGRLLGWNSVENSHQQESGRSDSTLNV